MKKYVVIGVIVALAFAVTCYVTYVPPARTGYLGLTYSWHGPQTNAGGELVYTVGVSNGGPHTVLTWGGTETFDGQHVTMNGSDPEAISPGKRVTFVLNVGRGPQQSRPMAYAQKVYGSDWRGTVAWHIETKVLKRPVFERVCGPF